MSSGNWRPENWTNPHQEDGWDCGDPNMGKVAHRTFEAGADAMLTLLRQSGQRILKGEQCFPSRTFSEVPGFAVFIPDK